MNRPQSGGYTNARPRYDWRALPFGGRASCGQSEVNSRRAINLDNSNTSVGNNALVSSTGSGNIALGQNAGGSVTTASNVTCIGTCRASGCDQSVKSRL
jgi:hypothetical protein